MTAHPAGCCCPHHRPPSGSPVAFLGPLLLLAAVVAVREAEVVNTVATALVLALCAIPAVWGIRQGLGEWRLRKLYDRPRQALPVVRKALPRGPLAIEAARPAVNDVAVEQDAWRMS